MKEFLFLLQIVLIFFWSYWLIIGLFGFGKATKVREKIPQKRFAILIPAHNEEQVIGPLLDNLKQLDYPKHVYDVILIADNSNDKTAEIGREKGAIVLEHTSLPGEPKGKPYAIKYALDYLGDRLTEDYDAIAIFDADNLVSLNYLKEMNNQLCGGDRLIQCYLDSKNPNDNWISAAYATAYYYMNRSWQLAKQRLKLGNAIGGTGFCVDTHLIKEIGWTARSLTEDLEFTIQCLLKGVPATWCHHARVYDEKPTGFKISMVQRLRWSRGHWDVCTRYSWKLLWKFFTKGDLRALDGFLYLINPGKVVIGSGVSFMLYLNRFLGDDWGGYLVPFWVWIGLLFLNLLYVAYCIKRDAEIKVRVVFACLSMLVFNYTYIPLFVWGFVTQNNKTWKRTDHTRSIAFASDQATIQS